MTTDQPGDDEVAVPDEVHEPFEQLLNFLLPQALDQIEEHGEFYPFGGYLTTDGQLQVVTGDPGKEFPEPQEVIDSLLVKLRHLVGGSEEVLAVGLVMDVETPPPDDDDGELLDAVAIEMEHRSGWADTSFVPYEVDEEGRCTDGELWGCCGEPRIFPRPAAD